MSSTATDLRAARALIDTPEKFAATVYGVLGALDAVTFEDVDVYRYRAMRNALFRADNNRRLVSINRRPHAEVLAIFDRAISAEREGRDGE